MNHVDMPLVFSPIRREDGLAVIELFNHYVRESDAAFPERPVPETFFAMMWPILEQYPSVAVKDEQGGLIGFGMLKPHNPLPAFAHTAEISYFISPEWVGRGIGSRMLAHLAGQAKHAGISCILAEISGNNEGSIRFHRREGFTECGRFSRVGIKNGRLFDTVWMQKGI